MAIRRRIVMNYRKVNVQDLIDWLDENNVTYKIRPHGDDNNKDPKERIIGTVNFYLDVYSGRDETAVRIKWECK